MSDQKKDEIKETWWSLLLGLVAIVPVAWLWGTVVSSWWLWFPVRLWGVSPLGAWDVAGLLPGLSFVRLWLVGEPKKTERPLVFQALRSACFALAIWGMSWVYARLAGVLV
jgi:hypothetical protein